MSASVFFRTRYLKKPRVQCTVIWGFHVFILNVPLFLNANRTVRLLKVYTVYRFFQTKVMSVMTFKVIPKKAEAGSIYRHDIIRYVVCRPSSQSTAPVLLLSHPSRMKFLFYRKITDVISGITFKVEPKKTYTCSLYRYDSIRYVVCRHP